MGFLSPSLRQLLLVCTVRAQLRQHIDQQISVCCAVFHYFSLSTCCRRVGLERRSINTSIKGFPFFAQSVCHLLFGACCLRVELGRIFVNTSINFVLFCDVFHYLPISTCCLRVRRSSFTTPRYFRLVALFLLISSLQHLVPSCNVGAQINLVNLCHMNHRSVTFFSV